jgi:pyruvate/2-oxoglutarate dehydrogenase complex dihydrolipoamide dehydrogenase (E3) component
MAEYDFDIAVIGGGAAGLTVTSGSAQLGAKTLLVEKERELGGDCLHFGCVPSKTLIKTAHVYHLMKGADRFGLPPVALPPVDYREVAKRIQSVINRIQDHDSRTRFCQLGARVEIGSPTFVDEHTIRLDGNTYSARTWVIATGSSPSIPPIEGLDKTAYVTNREIFALERLPKSMICLGAGPVAVEMAQAFSRLGTKVTVMQRDSQILPREDRDMADELMYVLASEGIEFHLNATVIRTVDHGDEKQVIFTNGEKTTLSRRAEKILVAVGRTPNLSGLGLEAIGVGFDGRGLRLDRRLRTNHKHIYGAGDVTGEFLFTHAAGYEGGIVVSNAIFHLPRRVDYTFVPWCTYTDPELAGIGINERAAAASGIDYSVWTEHFKDNDRCLAEGEMMGKIRMIVDGRERPIGVQILGPRAGELLNEWVALLNGRVKLTTLASSMHPYPTLGEINKRVAGSLLSRKIFSEKMRKRLSWFFSLKGRACS